MSVSYVKKGGLYLSDITNTQTKIYKPTYLDMYTRYAAYKKKYGKEPNIIYTKPNQKGDYVQLKQFNNMRLRFDTWWKKNGKQPEYVIVKSSTTNGTSVSTCNGWVLTGTYKGDYQDTSYTCGPSSTQMVFSALGKTVNEAYIAKLAETGKAGTSHAGLAKAVHSIDSSIKITEYSYSGIKIEGIASKLKGNCEFIIHIRTGQLTKDAYGNRVWTNDYGHYIFLVGVNTAKGLFRVFDPTKGLKDFTTAQITAATAAVTGQNSFICHCK